MKQLPGDLAAYNFKAFIDGRDIFVPPCRATFFGGPNDPGDNGIGASGYSSRDNPSVLGCALPMQGFRGFCRGTPLPRLPWFTPVIVTNDGREVQTILIDLGPAAFPRANAGIDLTPAVFAAFGIALRRNRPVQGELRVSYRIPGGAAFVS